MNEIHAAIALMGIAIGAFANTWVGKTKSGEPYDVQQLVSSLIISAFAGFATIQWDTISNQIANIGYIGTFIAYVVGGFVLDKGLSKLDTGLLKSSFTKKGGWARTNDTRWLNNWVSRLEAELEASKEELKLAEKYPNQDFRDVYVRLVQREIRKTERELREAIDYRNDVMSRPTWENMKIPS